MRLRSRSRSLRIALSLSLSMGAMLSFASSAQAQPKEYGGFGEKGRVIISADRFLTLFSFVSRTDTSEDVNNNQIIERKTTTSGPALSLLLGGNEPRENVHTIPRVSLDYTVIPQLTIGGSVAVAFGLGGKQETTAGGVSRSIDAPNRTILGFVPRVGYIFNLNDTIAFWPRAGFGMYRVSDSKEDLDKNVRVEVTDASTYFSLDLDPQFTFLPFPHVGITAGPLVNIPLAGSRTLTAKLPNGETSRSTDTKTFQFGVTAGLLVWF